MHAADVLVPLFVRLVSFFQPACAFVQFDLSARLIITVSNCQVELSFIAVKLIFEWRLASSVPLTYAFGLVGAQLQLLHLVNLRSVVHAAVDFLALLICFSSFSPPICAFSHLDPRKQMTNSPVNLTFSAVRHLFYGRAQLQLLHQFSWRLFYFFHFLLALQSSCVVFLRTVLIPVEIFHFLLVSPLYF